MTTQPDLNTALDLHRAGRLAEAEAIYRRILSIEPKNAAALHFLGALLHQTARSAQGVELIQQSIALNPNVASSYNNLGEALRACDRYAQAETAYRNALKLRPVYPEATNNLGIALGQQNRLDEGLPFLRRAVELSPANPEYHWNLAVMLLLRGDFANGWREFEWRLQHRGLSSAPPFATQRWNGRPLPGQTLLIWGEQGMGDMIQFFRFLPLLRPSQARIVLDVHAELVSLFAAQNVCDEVIADPYPPMTQAHAALMSLPDILNLQSQTLADSVPYLKPTQDRLEKWRVLLAPHTGRRIGLAWSGRATHPNDRQRSIPAVVFSQIGPIQNGSYFIVQPLPANVPRPPGLPIVDLSQHIKDFADAAALINLLDLLITVDTSVAHLAGAMGKPVWTLLPFAPDWRWLLNRDDTPWYPSMKLFRQTTAGDWTAPLVRIGQSLASFLPTPASTDQ